MLHASTLNAPSNPENAQVARALGISMIEGAFHALMVGVAESYLGAFAVELGHDARALALLATLPLMLGAGIQLLTPSLCLLLGSRKRVVVGGAVAQALSLLGFVGIAHTQNSSFAVLLGTKVAFWLSASLIGPAWNAWMATLSEHTERERYFARRSGVTYTALLAAFVAAGLTLHHAAAQPLRAYSLLFALGTAARLASALLLALQPDPPGPLAASPAQPGALKKLLGAWDAGKFRLPLYLALLACGVQCAAPFFTPYMLRELRLDYASFAALSAVSILAKALVFPLLHPLSTRFGIRKILTAAGIGIAVIPLLWASSTRFETLLLANVLGGLAWAGLEYASFQLLLSLAPTQFETEYFALANTLTGLGQLSGAMIGGALLDAQVLSFAQVFLLSAIARALPLFTLLLALPHFPRALRKLYMRLLSTRPGAGAAQQPILAPSHGPLSTPSTRPPPPRPPEPS